MKMSAVWIGFLALAAFSGGPSFAQQNTPCDARLLKAGEASSSKYRYSTRSGGNYCDGVIGVKHAGMLVLLSVTLGQVPSDPAALKSFRVMHPPGAPSDALRLLATELSADGTYRLDGWVRADGLVVNRADVLNPLKIATQQLGFKAWRAGSIPEEYVPVVVGQPASLADIFVGVRASAEMRVIEMEILGPRGEVVQTRRTVATGTAEGAAVFLQIPRPMAGANWVVKIGGETALNTAPADVVISLVVPKAS